MPERLEDGLREQIRADYVVMGSVNKVAKKHKVSWATVKSILAEAPDELQEQRIAKRKEFIDEAWEVANIYLDRLKDPKVIKDVKARDAVIVYGTLVDKVQKDQELWLRFDEIWERVYAVLKEDLLSSLRDDSQAYAAIMKFVEKQKEPLKNQVRERLETKSKEIREAVDRVRNEFVHNGYYSDAYENQKKVEDACIAVAKEVAASMYKEIIDQEAKEGKKEIRRERGF